MTALNIISAGAAKAIVIDVAERAENDKLMYVNAKFGAVGALLKDVEAGNSFDVIILTDLLIQQLVQGGYINSSSRVDLGYVKTGIAVPLGSAFRSVSLPEEIRDVLLDADKIICPDPSVASAGRALIRALQRLGIIENVKNKLEFFDNGTSAMQALINMADKQVVGVMQVSEIIASQQLMLIGTLPEEPQERVVYSIAISNKTNNGENSRIFVKKLIEDQGFLIRSGFDPVGEYEASP